MTSLSAQEKRRLAAQLAEGIRQLELNLGQKQQSLLLQYLELLVKWNRVYNLSGIRDPAAMLSLHILDSLSILSHLTPGRGLDVGTGAGLPGIPLAIALPDAGFTLLDSNGKKTRFLIQSIAALDLNNVSVVHDRAENYRADRVYDYILSRAFSTLAVFVQQTRHLLGESGKLLAMKGHYPQPELDALPEDFKLLNVYRLQVPGEAGARHLIELGRT